VKTLLLLKLKKTTFKKENIMGKQNKNQKTRDPLKVSVKSPTPEQIRERAHKIYLARGGGGNPAGTPDQELADWLQAERELKITGQMPEDYPEGLDHPFPTQG
jgi:hypothetical protein